MRLIVKVAILAITFSEFTAEKPELDNLPCCS